MRATVPYFYVRPDEEVLLRARAAPGYAVLWFLAGAVVPTVLLLLFLLVLPLAAPEAEAYRGEAFLAYAALLTLSALVGWRRQATTEYVLTGERVYARTGRLFVSVHFTTHDKVTDMRYRQGPLERLVGVSGLSFATAGGDVQVRGVRDAIAIKERAEAARDEFVQRLLEEAGQDARLYGAPMAAPETAAEGELPARPAPGASGAPLPPPPEWTGPRPDYVKATDTPVWMEQPRPISALSSAKAILGILPILFFMSLSRPQARLLIPGLLLAALVLLVGMRYVQITRTQYVATDRRIYARSGVLGTTVNQLTYDKITDITYRQDLLGRLLGYGSVIVTTAGGGAAPITMHGLGDPLGAKETIERWRGRYLREDEA